MSGGKVNRVAYMTFVYEVDYVRELLQDEEFRKEVMLTIAYLQQFKEEGNLVWDEVPAELLRKARVVADFLKKVLKGAATDRELVNSHVYFRLIMDIDYAVCCDSGMEEIMADLEELEI